MTDRPAFGLLVLWPIVDEARSRDVLIDEATAALGSGCVDWLDTAGRPAPGPATWRIFDAADLPGFEWMSGQLLVATMPGAPAHIARRLEVQTA